MSKQVRGTIDYLGDGVGLRGREEWLLSVHGDGTRMLRAHCEMWDTEIEREVVHTVSSGFGPLRTFISLRVQGDFIGEGWFDFQRDVVQSALLREGHGRSVQRLPLLQEPCFFVPHAVCCDAWIVPAYSIGAGGRQSLSGGWRSSPRANGSTGPLAEMMEPVTVTMLGEERVKVPAGTFDTQHFAVEQVDGQRDDIWTMTEDYLLVQLRSDILNSWYRLAEISAGPGPGRRA